MIKKKAIYIILIFLPLFEAFAVFPNSEIITRKVEPNNDTLVFIRSHGDWWFGADIGANLGVYFGKLNIPYIPTEPYDTLTNPLSNYNNGSGTGIYLGLIGQYHPVGKKLGGSLKIHFLDYRPSFSGTDPYKKKNKDTLTSDLNLRNESEFLSYMISFSPEVTYNFGVQYLNLFGGFDFDYLISDKSKVYTKFDNTGQITEVKPFSKKSTKVRFGGFIGMEYDIFVADISNKARAFLSPFFSLHGGSTIYSEYYSSRNTFLFRVGFSAKLTLDRVEAQSIHFNKEYEKPPDNLADFRYEKKIKFSGFQGTPTGGELTYLPQTQISQELAETPKVSALIATNTPTVQAEATILNITPNENKRFFYQRSEQTGLTQEMQIFLDEVAEFMKQNPRATVRVVGHSDNAGNLNQNMQRSLDRAKQVVDYLVKKKISRGRILDRGAGALEPIENNATAAGRRQNRRVDIRVVQ